jgi:hypothetical protein
VARILFATGGGGLYQFAFEGSRQHGAEPGGCDVRPEPLYWDAPQLGLRPALATDPSWPADPRLGRRVLVALWTEASDGRGASDNDWRLWWLRVSSGGTVIEQAGRLTRHGTAPAAPGDDHGRFPTLVAGPAGPMMLAYLVHREGRRFSQLRIAPIRLDAETGDPSIALSESRALADDCLALAPVASADGKWICCVIQRAGGAPEVRRIAVGEAG